MRRGNLKEEVHLDDLSVNGRIILKQILKEWDGRNVCIVVVVLCALLSSYVYLLCSMSNTVFTLDARLLAISQYSEGPATVHLDTGFSWFPCVYKEMLSWFPRFQVATTCFSCSPPELNLLVTNFIFCIHVK